MYRAIRNIKKSSNKKSFNINDLHFITVDWINISKSAKVKDFIYNDDDHFLILSIEEYKFKYDFYMSKSLSKDMNELLIHSLKLIYPNAPEFKIINLGFHCSENFVEGNFEI